VKKQPKNGKSKKFSTKLSSWKGKFPKPKPKTKSENFQGNLRLQKSKWK